MTTVVLLMLTAGINKGISQPIPVGNVKESQFRLLQLLSDSALTTSLNDRPLWEKTYRSIFNDPEIQQYRTSWWANPLDDTEKKLGKSWRFGFYAPTVTNTINSDLPLGGNNGSAWYGRGLNTEFQGGFYLTSKYVTATFRPHITYSQNSDFSTPRFIPRDADGNPEYTAIFPNIDMPYRFGPDSFTDFNLGQTSISLHYKSIEAGLSTEPLWWGPGIQNALVLSNNAPGLRHAFLGTRAPLALPLGIGDLEFKFIWGEPKDSKYFSTTPKTDHQRFTTGTNFNYSPGFASNLSLGFTLITHKYIPSGGLTLSDFADSIPLLSSAKSRASVGTGQKNLLGSIYFRWAFPESGAEIYGEYFREDNFYNARDLFLEPNHDRAYTIGFQKVVENDGRINLFKIDGEISSLLPGRVAAVRKAVYYYTHSKVRQGHTNEGQLLGATIGPGSTSQYLGVKGYFNKGDLGLFAQRVAQNDYFYYNYYRFYYFLQDRSDFFGATATKDIYRNRVNLNIGIDGHYKIGNFLLSGKIIWNNNLNYGRFNYGHLDGINFSSIQYHDVLNMQFQLSVRYYLGKNIFK